MNFFKYAITMTSDSFFRSKSGYKYPFGNSCLYHLVCFVFISFQTLSLAQPFSEIDLNLNSWGVGQISFGDYDNDNDLDLLWYGMLYRNDAGTYNFVKYLRTGTESGAFGDYDNDGDMDILITGGDFAGLFRNDGGGNFTEVAAEIKGVTKSSCLFVDFDGDGDLDIIISGILTSGDPSTIVYRNDKNDVFIIVETGLKNLGEGSLAFGDFDNDYDFDIILSGRDFNGNAYTGIFRKENNNTFTETDHDLVDVFRSTTVPADFNSDGYLDVFISGNWDQSAIYKNNPDNTLTIIAAEITGMRESKSDWGDYDNDGYNDLLVTGASTNAYTRITKLYRNTLDDTFTEQIHNFPPLFPAYVKWCDYDNDNDLDLFIFGNDISNTAKQLIYKNNTAAKNIKPSTSTGLSYSQYGNGVRLSWLPSTDSKTPSAGLTYNIRMGTSPGAINVISPMSNTITGFRRVITPGNAGNGTTWIINNLQPGVTYYWSVQSVDNAGGASEFSAESNFTIADPFTYIDIGLTDLRIREVAWGDYDNDNDMDFMCCGKIISTSTPFTRIYRNDGGNNFTKLSFEPGTIPDQYFYNQINWFDLDNDNDLDIIIIGNEITKVYRNLGAGNFEEVNAGLPEVPYPYSCLGDLNNDGFTDVIIIGDNSARVFLNTNQGNFAEKILNIYKYPSNSLALADFDGDMYIDIFMPAYSEIKIYRNSKLAFEPVVNNLLPLNFGNVEIGDYNNDGLIDVLYNGSNGNNRFTKILKNSGNMLFEDINANIRGVQDGIAVWADYDNDSDLDVLIGGQSIINLTRIAVQDITHNFTEIDPGFPDSYMPAMQWADTDGDWDLDLLFNPYLNNAPNGLWINNGNWPNDPPFPPANLSSELSGYGIIFNWDPATDPQGGSSGLSYNVRIGSTPGSCDIMSPLSDLTTGFRKIPKIGNTQTTTAWRIDSLAQGTYYWSVQAIDQSFRGGAWAPEATFTIDVLNADFIADTVCLGNNTSFTDVSLNTGSPVTEWSWDFGDGETSASQNPVHLYSAPGEYLVKLIIHSPESSDSVSKTLMVKQVPKADFTVGAVCLGTVSSFSNTTDPNGLTMAYWHWAFGDEQSSTIQNPGTHGYLNPGEYQVTLTATATNACASVAKKTAVVGAYPVAAITANAPLTFCAGDSVTLSVANNPDYSYQWRLGGTPITGGESYSIKARQTGSYSVQVVNPLGNCTTLSEAVSVTARNAPVSPTIIEGGPVSFCQGDSVVLSVTHDPELTYRWKLNGGDVGISTNEYKARAEGTYNLVVLNSTGCSSVSTNTVQVTVKSNPVLSTVSMSGPTTFCEGGELTMSVPFTMGYTYRWENEFGAITGAESNSHLAVSSGNYRLAIGSTDGCEVKTPPIQVTVKENPVQPVIATENYESGQCLGDIPIVLKANPTMPGYTYQWKRNGIIIPGATQGRYEGIREAGEYTVQADNQGCRAESGVQSVILGQGPPKPALIAEGPVVWYLACSNDSAAQYRWYYDGQLISGAGKHIYVANQELGTYMVAISTGQGCFTFSDPMTIPPEAIGIDDVDVFSTLQIFPNPTAGMFTIVMNNQLYGDVIVSVFTEEGRKVWNGRYDKITEYFSCGVDMGVNGSGVYFVNLRAGKNEVTRKVVVM